MTFKLHVQTDAFNGDKLAITFQEGVQRRSFVQPFVLETFPPHTVVPDQKAYCIRDDGMSDNVRGFLQAAMDAAWEYGLRPAGIKDLTGELGATKRHLEDMRTLALAPTVLSEVRRGE